MNKNLFDRLDEWVNDTEGSLVNFLTAFAPWLAPLAPAYMTYQHMVDFLVFPKILAGCLALLVEILGFGTVSTFLDFWFHNRRERAEAKKAPLGIVIFSFSFYLGLILISNVTIDLAKSFGSVSQLSWAIVGVRALLTLQTIPGAMIVAVRTGHRELLKQIKQEKLEKGSGKSSETKSKTKDDVSETFRNFPKDWRNLRPTLKHEDVVSLANLSPAQMREMSQQYGVTEKTISNWRASAREELSKNKNPMSF